MWFPAGTPRERIMRIQQEVAKILRMPEIRKIFDDAGLRPVGSTPEEFAAFIQKDLAFFAKALRDAKGIEPPSKSPREEEKKRGNVQMDSLCSV